MVLDVVQTFLVIKSFVSKKELAHNSILPVHDQVGWIKITCEVSCHVFTRRRLLSRVMCTRIYNFSNLQEDLVPRVHDWVLSSSVFQPLRLA